MLAGIDETTRQLFLSFQEAERVYSDYVAEHGSWNSGCSGVGSCDYCNKRLYPKRTVYLKLYVRLYKQVRNTPNKDLCPPLNWFYVETASKCKAGEFHREKCSLVNNEDEPYDVADCPCALADFMRTAYGADDTTKLRSFKDQIYPIFVKIVVGKK